MLHIAILFVSYIYEYTIKTSFLCYFLDFSFILLSFAYQFLLILGFFRALLTYFNSWQQFMHIYIYICYHMVWWILYGTELNEKHTHAHTHTEYVFSYFYLWNSGITTKTMDSCVRAEAIWSQVFHAFWSQYEDVYLPHATIIVVINKKNTLLGLLFQQYQNFNSCTFADWNNFFFVYTALTNMKRVQKRSTARHKEYAY